jgi:hypothetical protein
MHHEETKKVMNRTPTAFLFLHIITDTNLRGWSHIRFILHVVVFSCRAPCDLRERLHLNNHNTPGQYMLQDYHDSTQITPIDRERLIDIFSVAYEKE